MRKTIVTALAFVLLFGGVYAATNFPTNLDTFTDQTASDLITSAKWNNLQDAIGALEAKVGADSSAVTTSHDYKLTELATTTGLMQDDITELATTLGLAQTNIASLQNVGKIKARAYRNAAQNIDASGYTKVAIDTISFDTESVVDVTTNNRITPTLAGYYQVNGQIYVKSIPDGQKVLALISKNGAAVSSGSWVNAGAAGNAGSIVTDLIYCNGTTDYLELYAYNENGSSLALFVGYSIYNHISIVGPF